MPQRTHNPKKPFMIMREDGDGNDFALVHKNLSMFMRWVDWTGSKFATREEAQYFIETEPKLERAKVIEVLQEIRFSTR